MIQDFQNKIRLMDQKIQELSQKIKSYGNELVIKGTTSSSANTQIMFPHLLGRKIRNWFPIKGNVYVFDSSERDLDIRSTQTSVEFEILIN